MSRSTIYTVSNGQLTAMKPSAPESEAVMQLLVADYPEIIADDDGDLLLIKREQPIGDGEGDGRWSLDHLFVTQEGVPVLVELKRAVDTRLRREVVGQMLDYAANATAHWKAGTVADSFEATTRAAGRDPWEVLAAFLPEGLEPETFWERVDASFAAGRVKLVFVADTIPRELARIVEFLNEQMKAEVRAVELNWFEAEGVKAFTPRVIGQTQRAQASKSSSRGLPPPISKEEWITSNMSRYGQEAVDGAYEFVEMVSSLDGHAEVAKAQGSLIGVFDLPFGAFFPMSVAYGKVTLNLGYMTHRRALKSEEKRQAIYDRLSKIVGGLSTETLSGFPGFPLALMNDASVREKVAGLLSAIIADALVE